MLEADELDEGSALAAGQRALGELRELARANARLAPRSAGELAEALRAVHFGSGQHHTPRTVAVLDPLAPRARRVAALFVCGMQQGVFPVAARLGSLLSREQRMRLSEKSGFRLGEQQDPLAAERYLLYAAASRPQHRLVLSWHAGGDDGAAAARSLFIDDVCDVFESSLLAGRLRARSPLAASRRNGRRSTSCAVPTRSAPLPRAPADSRSGARERGGAIAPLRDQELLAELRARIWSASALECWMGCPVRWFVERMLRARDLDPEAEPLARGGLAHAALRQTLERLKRQTGSARLTPANLGAARELLAQALAEHGEDHPLSAAREREPALRRRLHADLERFLEHASGGCRERAAGAQERDEQSGRQQLEPGHLELEFGFGASDRGDGVQPASACAGGSGDGVGAAPLPALDLGDGVMLRGRVDRVDVSADGRMAVVHDYKGRSASPAAKWLAGGELQVALYMRAVEQLLGAQSVGGFYQPLSGRDLRARGVLAREAEVELECVAPDRWEDADVRALLDAAATAAREVAVRARSGELHARPASCAWGGGCSYPTICRAEH